MINEVENSQTLKESLILVSRDKNDESLKELHENGLDINTVIDRGSTFLHYAAINNNLDRVKYLCDKGIDINKRNDEGKTALYLATQMINIDITRYLCKKGALVDLQNNHGWTPLHIAVKRNKLGITRILCEKSKNVTLKTNTGLTAMHFAARNNSFSIMQLLKKKGAELMVKDKFGKTAFDYVMKHLNLDTLHRVESLGININQVSSEGSTILHHAICKQIISNEILNDFLKKGANVKLRNKKGYSAIDYALRTSFDSFATILQNEISIDPFCYNAYVKLEIFEILSQFLDKSNFYGSKKTNKKGNVKIATKVKDMLFFYGRTFRNKNISEDEDCINSIIMDCFEKDALCLFDINNPHLLLCTQELLDGHSCCLRCVFNVKMNNDVVVCFEQNCYNHWSNDVLTLDKLVSMPKHSKIKEVEKQSQKAILEGGIEALNRSIKHVFVLEEKFKNSQFPNFLEILEYQEDIMEIKMQSIEMELEKVKKKVFCFLKKIKQNFKIPQHNINMVERNVMRIILNLKNNAHKELKTENIGILKVQPSFMNLDTDFSNVTRTLEKNCATLNQNDEKSIVVEQLKSYSGNLNTIDSIKKLIQIDNLINNTIHNLNDLGKLDGIVSVRNEAEAVRQRISQDLCFNFEVDSFDPSAFQTQIFNLLQAKTSDTFLSIIHTLFLDRGPTEYEIKAFKSAKYGTFRELRETIENHDVRINRTHYFHEKTTLLIEAVFSQDLNMVEYLIDKGCDLNITDENSRTLLQIAALNNNQDEIIKLLIEKNSNFGSDILKAVLLDDIQEIKRIKINEQDNFGATELHYIAARCKRKLLRCVNDIDTADISIRDKTGLTCIERGALMGDLEMMKDLFQIFNKNSKISIYTIKSIIQKTLLDGGNIEILNWLFEAYKDSLENTTNIDYSALVLWIGGDNCELINKKIEFIINKGGKLSKLSDVNKENILMLLCGDVDCLYNPLSLEFLDYMVLNGLNIEHKNKFDQNILHLAAESGNLELVKILSQRLPNTLLNTVDNYGYTPIMYAIENGHLDVVKWMMSFRTSICINENDLTILDLALANGYEDICKVLKDSGVESNLHKYFNSVLKVSLIELANPLYLNAHKLRKISLKRGDRKHKTEVLIIKCFKCCSLKLLFEYKIPFHKYIDDYGAHALHISAAFGRNDLILWLFMNHSNFQTADNAGLYGIVYASLNGYGSTVFLFNILDPCNLIKRNSEPLLNIFKFEMSMRRKFEFIVALEELALALPLLKNSSEFITDSEIKKLRGNLKNCSKNYPEFF